MEKKRFLKSVIFFFLLFSSFSFDLSTLLKKRKRKKEKRKREGREKEEKEGNNSHDGKIVQKGREIPRITDLVFNITVERSIQ
jgi:hypothetical protein